MACEDFLATLLSSLVDQKSLKDSEEEHISEILLCLRLLELSNPVGQRNTRLDHLAERLARPLANLLRACVEVTSRTSRRNEDCMAE